MRKILLLNLFLGVLLGTFTAQASAECPPPCPSPDKLSSQDCSYINWWQGKYKGSVDYLYWESVEGQLLIGNKITRDDTQTYIDSYNIRPKFGSMSGFKAGLTYEVPTENKWELTVNGGYIPGKANTGLITTVNPPDATKEERTQFILLKTQNYDVLAATGKLDVGEDLSAQYSSVAGYWTVKTWDIALTLARSIPFFNEAVTIKPYVGINGRFSDQQYIVHATGFEDYEDFGVTQLTIDMKTKMKSILGTGGLWVTWDIGCGFSLTGNFGGSAGYTDWHTSQSLVDVDSIQGLYLEATVFDRFPSIGYGIDYFIGIQYSKTICKQTIVAKLGWERHITQQNYINAIGANLGTQGLTAGVNVTF